MRRTFAAGSGSVPVVEMCAGDLSFTARKFDVEVWAAGCGNGSSELVLEFRDFQGVGPTSLPPQAVESRSWCTR